MRFAYFAGVPGLLASASVWFIAGIVTWLQTPGTGAVALFFGGMLIHPLGILVAKLLGRPGQHQRGNPLGQLAMESTVLMLIGIALAFAVASFRIEWFFPAMLLVIGGRYLVFATVYGLRQYWLCGAALALSGFALVALQAPAIAGAFAGAAIEFAFAALLFPLGRQAAALAPCTTE